VVGTVGSCCHFAQRLRACRRALAFPAMPRSQHTWLIKREGVESMKKLILLAVLLSLTLLALIIYYWDFIRSDSQPFMLVENLVLVMITAVYVIYTRDLAHSGQKQIASQIEQFQLESRPFVFISNWGEFQKLEGMQTMRFILENVGKLPACFDTIEYAMIVGGKRFNFQGQDFQKPSFIFPGQKNIHLDLPVPNALMVDIKANGGFQMECQVNYYSLTDKSRQCKYYYSVKYDLRMKSPDSNTIDEYVLREIRAE
jgi:hypothetical protein